MQFGKLEVFSKFCVYKLCFVLLTICNNIKFGKIQTIKFSQVIAWKHEIYTLHVFEIVKFKLVK